MDIDRLKWSSDIRCASCDRETGLYHGDFDNSTKFEFECNHCGKVNDVMVELIPEYGIRVREEFPE